MNMDESIMFSDVEVGWDHDSPTPAAWRMLQGPGRSEDTQCSPQLPRSKRMVPRHPRPSTDNYPGFEESRKEVDQIINALRKASKEGETSKSNIERRLVIPDLPEEEESEDERNFDTVPFKELSTNHPKSNTSIDLLFDMSGRGEDLALTAKSSNPECRKSQKHLRTPATDVWTDDDLFADDALMSEFDNSMTTAPPKSMKLVKNENSAAQKTSTPFNPAKRSNPTKSTPSKAVGSSSSAKGFLDFFMDDRKPAKPSPQKEKSRVLPQKKNNYKFVSKGASSNTTANAAKRTGIQNETAQSTSKMSSNKAQSHSMANKNDGTMGRMGEKSFSKTMPTNNTVRKSSMPNSFVANATKTNNSNRRNQFNRKESKPMETSIPLDVLELIAEDSWTENEDDAPKVPLKNTTKIITPSTSSISAIANNHKNSYKFTKTSTSSNVVKSFPASKTNLNAVANKQISAIRREKPNVSSDGFSSDDEDMLLEAVALSESQKCTKGGSSSAPNPVKKAVSSTVRSNPPSQSRCTASEIERKKQQALERKKQRMKQQQKFLR